MTQRLDKITLLQRQALVQAEQKGVSDALEALLKRSARAYSGGDDEWARTLRDLANTIHRALMPSIYARLTDLNQRLAEYDEVNPNCQPNNNEPTEESNT